MSNNPLQNPHRGLASNGHAPHIDIIESEFSFFVDAAKLGWPVQCRHHNHRQPVWQRNSGIEVKTTQIQMRS